MADTPKRITRAASRAASDRGTPAPVPASYRSPSAGGAGRAGNADQGRSPAKRDTRELPPLPSKTSNAYGGAGREALAEGLQVHHPEIDFAQVFDTRRVEAVQRSHDDRAARVERRSSQEPSPDPQEIFKRRINHVKLTVQPIREESEEFDKGGENANARLRGIFSDKKAAAGTGNLQEWTQVEHRRQTKEQERGGSYQPQAHGNVNSTTLLVDPTAHGYRGENRAAFRAGSQRYGGQNRDGPTPGTGSQAAREVSWTSQPYFRKLWSILATILILLGVFFLVRLRPEHISTPDKGNTFHPIESMKEYSDSTWTGVLRYASRWGNPNHANYPWGLAHTVKNLESQLLSLTSSTALHDDSIKELQRILPDIVVMSRKNGVYEIPDDFWHALKDKLSDNPEAVGWETFLAKNEVQLRAFTDTELNSHARRNTERQRYCQRQYVHRHDPRKPRLSCCRNRPPAFQPRISHLHCRSHCFRKRSSRRQVGHPRAAEPNTLHATQHPRRGKLRPKFKLCSEKRKLLLRKSRRSGRPLSLQFYPEQASAENYCTL